MPEVSVLVPSYNHAPFVERTLRSIFAQTFHPKKLIVIDDGSKDESVEIIRSILPECPYPNELIVRENRGLCFTLNEGFAKAEGEFFAYLGSDDIWFPNFLAESLGLLEKRPAAVLSFGNAYVIDEAENIVDRTDNWADFADGDMLPQLMRGEIFSSPGVVYRSSALKKYLWNEHAKLEDYEMYLNLSTEGEFAKTEKILCAWRRHDSNASGNYPEMFPELIRAQNRVFERLEITRNQLDRIQTELKFNSIPEFIRSGNRRQALTMMINNFRGAKSPVQFAKMLFRLAVPQTLFQLNRNRKKRAAIEKYGKLEI